MKKLSFAFVFFLFQFFYSCQSEFENLVTDSKVIQLSLKVPETSSTKKIRESEESVSLRFVIEVFQEDVGPDCYKRFTKIADGNKLDLDIETPSSSNCKIVLWADYVLKEQIMSESLIHDLHFDTSNGLKCIQVKGASDVYSSRADLRDAFSSTVDIPSNASGEIISVALTRITSALRIYTSDLNSYAVFKKPNSTKVQLQAPDSFDAYRQTYGESKTAWNFKTEIQSSVSKDQTQDVLIHESYIFAVDGESILDKFSIDFYNGEDLVNAFECTNIPVKRNYRTNIRGALLTNSTTINVSVDTSFDSDEDGGSEDPVIPSFEDIIVSESANSYILNPKNGNIIYHLPIDFQNQYYIKSSQFSNAISEGEIWKAKVLWTEVEGLLEIDEDGYGDGTYAIKLKLNKQGNALIGIYKDLNNNNSQDSNEPLLWSYHIWITDYNPNHDIGLVGDAITFDVPGGKVHRIANQIIMDRNLGNIPVSSNQSIGQLCYQYGRKDPFPSITTGQTITFKDQKVTIANSIISPMTLYGVKLQTPSSYIWTNEMLGSDYGWSDLKSSKKSTFDPCPKGWKVPSKDFFISLLEIPNVVYTDNEIIIENDIILKKQNYRRASNGEIGDQAFMYLTEEHDSSKNLAHGLGIDTKTNKPSMISIFYSSASTVRCVRE
ncbi:MAG: DUF6562 domain-containing protein [Bacteroidales bacterium]